ncbi:MAG: hydroxymethylbilane synthase [Methanoregulaceae archaeon]|jgi:hydroxymethylbilane synthase|nr:hydroxymethylbilane synthase [Methanoregulaceae archaeon]
MPLKIGTRGSTLALAQAEKVAGMLRESGHEVELSIISTLGDEVSGVPLHEIGGQGVFVRALDEAILAGSIDAAVHSMKDIPAKRPAGLSTCAILERDSPADFLVHSVPEKEIRVIGTSSTRRMAQLKRYRKGSDIRPVRGNVDTRLRKLSEGQFDAIVLAEAGLVRMSLSVPGMRLPPDVHVPAPNQGTIAVVGRDDPAVTLPLSRLDHPQTRLDVEIERRVMEEIGGGCYTPQGIYCRDRYLIAEILSLDGERRVRREEEIGSMDEATECGRLLRKEGAELIREAASTLGLSE